MTFTAPLLIIRFIFSLEKHIQMNQMMNSCIPPNGYHFHSFPRLNRRGGIGGGNEINSRKLLEPFLVVHITISVPALNEKFEILFITSGFNKRGLHFVCVLAFTIWNSSFRNEFQELQSFFLMNGRAMPVIIGYFNAPFKSVYVYLTNENDSRGT